MSRANLEPTADPIGEPPRSKYKEQHGVIIICAGEAEQQAIYEELLPRGWKLKVVSV